MKHSVFLVLVVILVLGSCTLRPELTGKTSNNGNNGLPDNAGRITLSYDGPYIYTNTLLTFQWDAQVSPNFVRLDLFRNNSYESIFLNYAPNAGVFTWLIPDDLPLADADMFQVKLTVYDSAINPQIIQEIQSVMFQIRRVGGGSGLSDVVVNSPSINLQMTDNGSMIDGDRVRVTLNGIVVHADLTLVADPGTILPVGLNRGMNTLVITALNEGTSSPNTAELRFSAVVSGNAVQEWRLTTGQTGQVKIYCQP